MQVSLSSEENQTLNQEVAKPSKNVVSPKLILGSTFLVVGVLAAQVGFILLAFGIGIIPVILCILSSAFAITGIGLTVAAVSPIPAVLLDEISYNPKAFKYAPEYLRRDKKFALAAVWKNGSALKFAGPDLQDNEEIVKAALDSNKKAFLFASPRIQKLPEFIKLAQV